MAFILSCSGCFYGAIWYSKLKFSSFHCAWVEGKRKRTFFEKQKGVKSSCYGLYNLTKAPMQEEHNSSEPSKGNSNEDAEKTGQHENKSGEDEATLEEMDRLAEEWIGQDLSRWYTYRKFQALRNKLLKQEEEEELDTQREYEELYANLLMFGKVIGFPLVNEETGKINLYGYMVMILFLLLPLVVVWYLGQTISSGVDWIIQHQSPF
ncbi:hypothetical protein Gasu2_19590 [Galdieria sulphuraria]|nr:hypothetical protein Gasu2_19590 [Galdieria sulphuraria]